jgi:hypothetical protein
MSPIHITRYTPNVQPGTYPAVVTDCSTRQAKDGGGEFRVWEFTLADDSGRTVSATSSMQTSPKSKAGKWIAAMIGRVPDPEEDIEVVGLPCTVSVILNDDGFERVETVIARAAPAPRRPTKAQDAPQGAVAVEVEEEATADPLPF